MKGRGGNYPFQGLAEAAGTPSAFVQAGGGIFGSPPCKRLMHNSPFSPLAGEMPKAEGGLSAAYIWYSPTDPPLSLRDISPRKGGRAELEVAHRSLQRGSEEREMRSELRCGNSENRRCY